MCQCWPILVVSIVEVRPRQEAWGWIFWQMQVHGVATCLLCIVQFRIAVLCFPWAGRQLKADKMLWGGQILDLKDPLQDGQQTQCSFCRWEILHWMRCNSCHVCKRSWQGTRACIGYSAVPTKYEHLIQSCLWVTDNCHGSKSFDIMKSGGIKW